MICHISRVCYGAKSDYVGLRCARPQTILRKLELVEETFPRLPRLSSKVVSELWPVENEITAPIPRRIWATLFWPHLLPTNVICCRRANEMGYAVRFSKPCPHGQVLIFPSTSDSPNDSWLFHQPIAVHGPGLSIWPNWAEESGSGSKLSLEACGMTESMKIYWRYIWRLLLLSLLIYVMWAMLFAGRWGVRYALLLSSPDTSAFYFSGLM